MFYNKITNPCSGSLANLLLSLYLSLLEIPVCDEDNSLPSYCLDIVSRLHVERKMFNLEFENQELDVAKTTFYSIKMN